MSGKKIIEGAKEALAVARGEQPAARIIVNGHAYIPEKSAPGYAQGFEAQPVAWRFRYEHKEGVWGKWTVQKNKPTWYQTDQSDVEIEPLYAALPAPAGESVTVEELADWLSDQGYLLIPDEYETAQEMKDAFTILTKPAQEARRWTKTN